MNIPRASVAEESDGCHAQVHQPALDVDSAFTPNTGKQLGGRRRVQSQTVEKLLELHKAEIIPYSR